MDRSAPPWVHSVAALTAGVVSTTLTHPLDLVKARFQVQHVSKQVDGELRYRSTLQAFRTIARTEGLAGLYRGVLPNVCGNGAAWGLYMLSYSWLKDTVGQGGDAPISLRALGLAALAGGFSSVLTNPIWLLKVSNSALHLFLR
jgi:solute carrier family 25 folate transporter 32